MKIEEQIKNAAWDYFQDLDSHHFHLLPHCNPQTDAFEAGAKWADKTMIDKACEWLKDNLYNSLDRDGRPTIDSSSCTSVNEFIKEFRKAIMIDDYEPTESLLDGDFSCETTEDWE